MSGTTSPTTAATPESLGQKILSGIKTFIGDAEQEGLAIASGVWDLTVNSVFSITAQQAKVLTDCLNRLDADAMAGKNIESIETDVLGVASADELAILKAVASTDLQAFIAMFKSANS